mmetsp:Transcript_40226/g.80013  ORF Transcript_40226/g.80013 Transcript_40226/m.80013 type:complete len:384 (-) Transcript_40226:17-1168(-)|eukprot:CAMPEP_0170360196 /NCGR_PEP_ID=MMETSP0117_2-20130122/3153_1 /TAXON_ID=400756 /ORGANISM="Durinskia baltica, Strain CSIRO CS-38" /LENGTH=383 /DNA_ID=CAMNT_0010614497 /DNA_START=97 /DNA_END=1248 /DNA_ORIENTATION=+
MSEQPSLIDSPELDIENFESLDFGLLDDDGNFEEFCLSMDFNPLQDCWNPCISGDTTNQTEPQPAVLDTVTKKRKFGTVMVEESSNQFQQLDPQQELSTSKPFESTIQQPNMESAQLVKEKEKEKDNSRSKTIHLDETDIRTKYVGIFANLFNNFDPRRLPVVANKYCTEDLLVIYEFVGVSPFGGPSYIEVRGVEALTLFWDNVISIVPDALFRIHSTKYKVLPNNFISIVSGYTFRGTKMFSMPVMDMHQEKVVLSMGKPDAMNSTVGASTGAGTGTSVGTAAGSHINGNSISTSSSNVPSHRMGNNTNGDTLILSLPAEDVENSPLIPNTNIHCGVERSKLVPMGASLVGTMTLYVNPENKVHRISFIYAIKAPDSTVKK